MLFAVFGWLDLAEGELSVRCPWRRQGAPGCGLDLELLLGLEPEFDFPACRAAGIQPQMISTLAHGFDFLLGPGGVGTVHDMRFRQRGGVMRPGRCGWELCHSAFGLALNKDVDDGLPGGGVL